MDFIYEPKMENSGCFDVYELDWKLNCFQGWLTLLKGGVDKRKMVLKMEMKPLKPYISYMNIIEP